MLTLWIIMDVSPDPGCLSYIQKKKQQPQNSLIKQLGLTNGCIQHSFHGVNCPHSQMWPHSTLAAASPSVFILWRRTRTSAVSLLRLRPRRRCLRGPRHRPLHIAVLTAPRWKEGASTSQKLRCDTFIPFQPPPSKKTNKQTKNPKYKPSQFLHFTFLIQTDQCGDKRQRDRDKAKREQLQLLWHVIDYLIQPLLLSHGVAGWKQSLPKLELRFSTENGA